MDLITTKEKIRAMLANYLVETSEGPRYVLSQFELGLVTEGIHAAGRRYGAEEYVRKTDLALYRTGNWPFEPAQEDAT